MRNDEILVQLASSGIQKTLAVTNTSGSAQALNSGNARWIFNAQGGDIAIKIGADNTVTGAAFTTGNWSLIIPQGISIVVRMPGSPETKPPYFVAISSTASATLNYCMVGN